jgi:hypothetical protein
MLRLGDVVLLLRRRMMAARRPPKQALGEQRLLTTQEPGEQHRNRVDSLFSRAPCSLPPWGSLVLQLQEVVPRSRE